MARYKATDGKSPAWLAIYNATSPEVFASPAYKALGANPSPGDKSIISRLAIFNRRIYKLDATALGPNPDQVLPTKYILFAGLDPKAEKIDDLHKWHADEHWGLMSKVPGFARARQYSLVAGSAVELAGKPDKSVELPPYPFINLVDWETDTFTSTEEFKAATTTPWAASALGELQKSELRVFTLHKSFKP